MVSKARILRNILGVAGRQNDVLYMQAKSQSTNDFLIFFGGDMQDFQENMEKHSDSKKYVKWSLENTAIELSERFPKNHIFIIRPTRMSVVKGSVFSCFDNFVSGDKYGTPTFNPMNKALEHLRELLFCCLKRLETLKVEKNILNIKATNLTLMGFSKGCVVLNQFLYEVNYYDENKGADINSFIKLIKDIWWLDSGHNGPNNVWITEKCILQSFAKLKINTHIHVTPYQMQNSYRPWSNFEENRFRESLKDMEVTVQRDLHFGDKAPSLSLHFNLLTDIGNNIT